MNAIPFILTLLIILSNSYSDVCKASTRLSLHNENELVRIFERGELGYQLFRIPALVKATDGSLLVFAEARKLASAGDAGDIDLVLKRSSDHGKTWSEIILVFDRGAQTCGNPVPIVDQSNGTIHLMMMLDNREVFFTQSSDHGLTWTPEREITAAVKPENWGFYATGPVHGIQVKNGPYRGRLIVPSYANVPVAGKIKHHSFCLYSDDHGATWTRGNLSPQENVGECTVVELADGRLMLNMRSKLPYRSIAYSRDGGNTWEERRIDTSLIDPPCQAALLDIVHAGSPLLLFSNPSSDKRENLTIRVSSNNGKTWHKTLRIYGGPSAYSDMVCLDEEHIGITFESGVNSPHGHIFFNRVALSKLVGP